VYPVTVTRQHLGKNYPILAMQQLIKDVTIKTNMHAKTEETSDVSFLQGQCHTKQNRKLLLPRTSCFEIGKVGYYSENCLLSRVQTESGTKDIDVLVQNFRESHKGWEEEEGKKRKLIL
jgi:hypothetical protein